MNDFHFSGQKVFLTGASGFIGTHLRRRLIELGAEVHGISRKSRRSSINNFHWWKGDLAHPDTTKKILKKIKPDVIIHLASHVKGARDLNQILPTFNSNLASTVNLLLAASELNCQRILLTGSMEEPEPNDPKGFPCSPYAAAKWASNGYADMFHALYQLPIVTLRVFMVYGPGQWDSHKLIPYVTSELLEKKVPELTNGKRKIDWIYIDDVVDAFLSAAQASGVEGKRFEIGSGKLISIENVVSQLKDIINPKLQLLFGAVPDRPYERVIKADTGFTKQYLHWKPMVSMQEGLERTVQWYRSNQGAGKNRNHRAREFQIPGKVP